MEVFSFVPDFVFEETIMHNTIISRFENGIEQRRRRWSRYFRRFKLVFRNRPNPYVAQLESFFNSRYGRYEAFYFEHPITGMYYVVRFDDDTFTKKLVAPNCYDVEFELQGVSA